MNKQKARAENILTIRHLRADDCEDIWRWRNDLLVRRYSFSQEEIGLPDHQAWFDKKLKDINTVMYLFENQQGAKVGQVRFDIKQDYTAYISVNMNPQYIGKGLGAFVISEASSMLFKEKPYVKSIQGEVMVDNLPSRKVFEKAGYLMQRQDMKQGKEFFVFMINSGRS